MKPILSLRIGAFAAAIALDCIVCIAAVPAEEPATEGQATKQPVAGAPDSRANAHDAQPENRGGIGAYVQPSDDGLRILAVAPDGGAARAGLQGGDEIVEVEGKEIAGMPIQEAVELFRGSLGSIVSLKVRRPGIGNPWDVRITRSAVERPEGAAGIHRKVAIEEIDPDRHVYGIPFGISEDELIAREGKPDGYLRLDAASTALIYGKKHAFLFQDGRFHGVRVTHRLFDWTLGKMTDFDSRFDDITWKLPGGIESGMNLTQVKEILGDRLMGVRHQWEFLTDKARVKFDFSHRVDLGETDDAYQIHGIVIQRNDSPE